jgi:hypothetical protein
MVKPDDLYEKVIKSSSSGRACGGTTVARMDFDVLYIHNVNRVQG